VARRREDHRRVGRIGRIAATLDDDVEAIVYRSEIILVAIFLL
jgi:hypothetical protein